MFGTIRLGVRAFIVGFIVGLLVAPRAGWQTRRLLRDRYTQFMDALTEVLALAEDPVTPPDRGARAGASAT